DAGYSHCLALQADGTVLAWGAEYGITPAPRDLPKAVAIAAGDLFSTVLLRDGAPHITVEPWGQSVQQGGVVRFTAKAVGQDLNYKWQLNGTDVPGAT